jgi:hypothetical protein
MQLQLDRLPIFALPLGVTATLSWPTVGIQYKDIKNARNIPATLTSVSRPETGVRKSNPKTIAPEFVSGTDSGAYWFSEHRCLVISYG